MTSIKLLFYIILTISTFTAARTNQSFVDETDIPEIGTESLIEDVLPPIDICEPGVPRWVGPGRLSPINSVT